MLRSYLVLAVKVLLRRPFFTFVSLFAICFTLAVLTTASSVLDHVFGPQAPETRQDRTLGFYVMGIRGDDYIWDGAPGYRFLDRYVRPLAGAEKVALFTEAALTASYQTGAKTELFLKRTDGVYWQILDFDFLEGRPITAEDEAAGAPVAVINAATRERLFGGGPAVGRPLEVDGQRFRVIGVVADVSSLRPNPFSDVWVPISTAKSAAYRDGFFGEFQALVLAPTAADRERLKSEFDALKTEIELPDREHYRTFYGGLDTHFEWVSKDYFSDDYGSSHPRRLWAAILGAMFLFLLLPSVNLININLSRILERASEIGVRKAFGAPGGSLVAQFIVENLVLTSIGGALGLVVSAALLGLLSDSQLVPYAQFELDLRVFGYGLLIALALGLLSGVYPAWRMSRLDPAEALRGRSL